MNEHTGRGQHDTHAARRPGVPAGGPAKPGYPEHPELPGGAGAGEHGRAVPETRFWVGEQTVGAQDVRAGQRAVVHGKRSGDRLIAVRVKLAPHKQ